MTPDSDLRSVMREKGLDTEDPLDVTGKLTRFSVKGDHSPNSWYVAHQHGDLCVALFGCWRRGIKEKWINKDRSSMSSEEWTAANESFKLAEEIRRTEEASNHARVRLKCATLFSSAEPARDHPYLVNKGVHAHGNLRISNDSVTPGWLAIPLQDETGTVNSAQLIADDGTKRFFFQGRIQGCWFPLAESADGPIVICEGFATGASIFEATGFSVMCAMSAGNILAVAKSIRALHKDRLIIIAADNDQFTEGNPGSKAALAAAKAIGATVAMPEFADECLGDHPTDFNDLHRLAGLELVKAQVEAGITMRAVPVEQLRVAVHNDPNELLKHGYLLKGGSLLVNGPSGMGKSAMLLQAFAFFACGSPFFDIQPARPLRCLMIQAENDESDMAEVWGDIIAGLKLTVPKGHIWIKSLAGGQVGLNFCREVLKPLLEHHKPDIVGIDPMNSFHGGDASKQTDVGQFLRQGIHPLLAEHKCAMIATHHTNKPPSGQQKPNWTNGELAYLSAGSAEWTNYPRAVISLQQTGTHGIYRMHAAKRGQKLRWRNEVGEPVYEKLIGHSKEFDKNGRPLIYWRAASEDELIDRGGRPRSFDSDQLVKLLGDSGLSTTDWRTEARESMGISGSTLDRAIREMVKDEKILKSKIDRKWKPITKKA